MPIARDASERTELRSSAPVVFSVIAEPQQHLPELPGIGDSTSFPAHQLVMLGASYDLFEVSKSLGNTRVLVVGVATNVVAWGSSESLPVEEHAHGECVRFIFNEYGVRNYVKHHLEGLQGLCGGVAANCSQVPRVAAAVYCSVNEGLQHPLRSIAFGPRFEGEYQKLGHVHGPEGTSEAKAKNRSFWLDKDFSERSGSLADFTRKETWKYWMTRLLFYGKWTTQSYRCSRASLREK